MHLINAPEKPLDFNPPILVHNDLRTKSLQLLAKPWLSGTRKPRVRMRSEVRNQALN
jgi:hypothetical protein